MAMIDMGAVAGMYATIGFLAGVIVGYAAHGIVSLAARLFSRDPKRG